MKLARQPETTQRPDAVAARRVAAAPETPRERHLRWRRRAGIVAVGMLAVGMGYGVVFGHNGLIVFAHKRQDARDLALQMKMLQKENDRLSLHVERLQSDPDGIEHQAREELHYTRSGEVIYTLPPHDPALSGGTAAPRN
jgi:cell division protein FtsB